MGLFGSNKKPLTDERAPGMPQHELALLVLMEIKIKADQERNVLIHKLANSLLSGDPEWCKPLDGTGFQSGRSIEHAAIAMAFKELNGRQW